MSDEKSKKRLPEVLSGDWEESAGSESESQLKVREAKFVEGLGKFGLESQALEYAGYSSTDSKAAWRLKQRSRVKFAIEQMKTQALEQAVMGRVQLIEQTKRLLDEARVNKQFTAVRGFNQDLAVLCGFGLRTGELETSAKNSESEIDLTACIHLGRMRAGQGFVDWERRELERIIGEYEKATGFVIPMADFSETMTKAAEGNPSAGYLEKCRGCGRVIEKKPVA